MKIPSQYKSMFRYELAAAAGVSMKTFSRWLKSDSEYLRTIGVDTKVKLLPPIAVKYICEKYVIDL